jgi:hypothetical protein
MEGHIPVVFVFCFSRIITQQGSMEVNHVYFLVERIVWDCVCMEVNEDVLPCSVYVVQ